MSTPHSDSDDTHVILLVISGYTAFALKMSIGAFPGLQTIKDTPLEQLERKVFDALKAIVEG
jgi:hypothetical protein